MSIKQTLEESANLLEVSVDEITSISRRQEYVFARTAITMLLRRDDYTLMEIAKIMNRTHGTISHYLKIYESEIKRNKSLQRSCKQLNIDVQNEK